MEFRLLKESEIDCRIAQIDKGWCTLLLYKDARVDQNILDETVGCMNWQKRHIMFQRISHWTQPCSCIPWISSLHIPLRRQSRDTVRMNVLYSHSWLQKERTPFQSSSLLST